MCICICSSPGRIGSNKQCFHNQFMHTCLLRATYVILMLWLCGGRDWCPGDKPFILSSRLLGKIEGPEARLTLKVPVMGFWLRATCVGAC